tara:strand:+ start:2915 stop:3655 length:741 start_codon:yes stop_codon:yes gene_type:complete
MIVLTLGVALLFAAIHMFIGRMSGLHGAERSGWLSFSGGVAITYVFLHVLPGLTIHNEILAEGNEAVAFMADHIVYFLAMIGLITFYGLDRTVVISRQAQRAAGAADVPHNTVFWIHIGAFAIYNFLIGYLLLNREDHSLFALGLYAFAMGVHFLTGDYGMWDHHKHLYQSKVRWIVSAALLAGWSTGAMVELHDPTISIIFGFLAGGVIMNVIKEELPEDRESRFGPFALGAAFYTVIVLSEGLI